MRLVVLHSLQTWISTTTTWLYTQVRFLPERVECHVACEQVAHLDQFPFPRIDCLMEKPPWRHLWDRALRSLGLRHHMGFVSALARRSRARVLHSHFGHQGWRDLAVARRHRMSHVVTFYGDDINYLPGVDPRWHARYREMFSRVDRVLCEGPHMAGAIAAKGCPASKIRVHHLGIDLSRIPYTPRVWTAGTPLRVLLAGSFREKKGFPYAIDALATLRDVDLEVTIIGDAHGGRTIPEKQRIMAALETSGLAPRTRLLGFQPYRVLLEEASRHHLFLSPSVTAADGDSEGGAPVTLIEMSASGMMIVSTTHCDIPGVIVHERTGLLAAERDVDGLVLHLRWLIANPARWRAMQDAGRAHIEAEFDARAQGERLAAIYDEIAASGGDNERRVG